jgi:eukaryotic-like serine/threonine-protein kinase
MPEPAFKRFGKYEIHAQLGRGGFGTVFRAFDPTVGRLVAIKVLASDSRTDVLTRFRNEAMAAGNLRHENIVTIYDFGEDNGVPFIAMEYLEGEDLQQALASGRHLTLLEKVSIMTQAAAGLDCAHRHGVVHRDVKPANIRLLPDGRVKIMDFGIARLVRDSGAARLTRQGHVLGTLLYMAPEQVMGSETDALCDIFAYGVTFYELLTGRHPFQAEDPRSVFYKITSEDPELIHHLVPDCPEILDHVIRRALQKDRELRYQTLRDLRVDVEPVLIALRKERSATLVTDAHGLVGDRHFERALSLLNEAIDLDASNHAARQLRDAVQVELRRRLVRPRIDVLLTKAEQSLAEGNYNDAVQTLEAALRLDPDDAALQARSREVQQQRDQIRESNRLLQEARADLAEESLAAALHKASEAVALNPKGADARTLLEIVQLEMKKSERQLRLNEKLRQARELLLLSSFDEALASMHALEPDERDSPEAAELLARLTAQKAEFERQERLRNEVTTARELLDRGRFIDAVQLLQRMRSDYPGEHRVEGLLSYAQQELAALERAQAIESLQGEVLTRAEAKRFDEAIELLTSAMSQYPGESGILRLRDTVLLARSAWERQQEVEQTVRRCEVLADQDRFDEALAALRETRRKYPDDAALDALQYRLDTGRERLRREKAVLNALQGSERLINEGRAEDAVAELEMALAQFADERLRLALSQAREAVTAKRRAALLEQIEREVRLELERHDFNRALQVLDRVSASLTGDPVLTRLQETALSAKAAWEREEAIAATQRDVQALRLEQRFEDAIDVVRSCRDQFPDSAVLARLDADLREEFDRRDRALAVRTAVEKARAAATQLARAAQFERALEVVDAVARSWPGQTEIENLRSEILAMQTATLPERENAAEESLGDQISSAHDEERERRASLQEALQQCTDLIAAGNLAEAGRALQNAMRDFPNEPDLAAMQQRLRTEWDRRRRSEATRRAIDNARALLDQGHPARAVELLQAAAEQYPDDPAVRDALIGAQEARGEQRRVEVDSVCRETRVYLDQNEFERALQTVELTLKTLTGEPRLVELRKTVIAARREFERAGSRKRAASAIQAVTDEVPIAPPTRDAEVTRVVARVDRPAQTQAVTRGLRRIALAGIGAFLTLTGALLAIRALRPGATAAVLEVETRPVGAAVKVGERSCNTPDCHLDLPAGSYRIDAQLPGYSAATEAVSIRRKETAHIQLVLVPLPTSLIITSNFTAGSVYVDDAMAGELKDGQFTLAKLRPGLHRVKISGPEGESSMNVKTGAALLPELDGQVAVRDADAIVVTSLGSSVRASCARCEGTLLLDGKPIATQTVTSGDHELTARTASGQTLRAFLRTNDAPTIAIHLSSTASSAGTLVVETNVDGALVSIDRRRLGRQTEAGRLVVSLQPRDYRIEVHKQGYRVSPERVIAKIRKGDQFRAAFRLEPYPGSLVISGAVEGATVAIDGSAAGTVRGGGFATTVSPGAHTVTLSKEGFKAISIQRSFEPGETVRLDSGALHLEPLPQPAKPALPPPPQQTAPAPRPPQSSSEEIEAGEWAVARGARDPAAIQAFLQKHPETARRQEAQQLLAQLEWESLDRSDRAALERFAGRHRGTPLAQQAASEIVRLEHDAAVAATRTADQKIAADRDEISKVLALYATAFEKKDLALLKTVWTTLPEASLAQAFRGKGVIRSQLRPLAPAEITGDRATVRCTRITEQVTQFGRQKPVEETRTVRLRRESGRWVIYGID